MGIRNRFRGTTPVAQWLTSGAGNAIRTIQRGTIVIPGASTSNTATITSVQFGNAIVAYLGCTVAGAENPSGSFARVTLTDATTVTATKGSGAGGQDDVTVSYEVIEFTSGVVKSIQRSTIAGGAGTATATISAVNIAKSRVDYLGMSTSDTGADNTWIARLDLTNATTVTATKTVGGATTGFQVVEFN